MVLAAMVQALDGLGLCKPASAIYRATIRWIVKNDVGIRAWKNCALGWIKVE